MNSQFRRGRAKVDRRILKGWGRSMGFPPALPRPQHRMPSLKSPDTILGKDLVGSPQQRPAPFSPSRQSSTSGKSELSLDEVTLAGDESPDDLKPIRRHTRFRSATIALDTATANFARYKKGKSKKSKGTWFIPVLVRAVQGSLIDMLPISI